MNIIKASYRIEIPPPPNALELIERIGRTCYKSEDRITAGSAEKFVAMVIERGHESVIEHLGMSVRFIVDRGVSHELVRHRLASYSQECVVGSTKVTKKYTIKELYDREENPQGKTHNKTIRLRSCREDGTIIRNKVVRVMHKGRQNTHKVTTKLGYVIETTGNHEFMLPDGSFRRLAEINVGESVMVNGRLSLLHITEEELHYYYLDLRQSPQEIADSFGAPYVSILRRLKNLGIFVKHRNDKNPEKYNKNHTRESYAKTRSTILKQYSDGREPRNNADDNLLRICINCHDKLHHGWHVGVVAHPDEVVSVEYAGEQDVYDIEMDAPYHNYVANGFVVHNSTRYCNYGGKGVTFIRPCFPGWDEGDMAVWEDSMRYAESQYRVLIARGKPPEESRSVLTTSLKTEVVMTQNFRTWRHVFRLRAVSKKAHPQMREVMCPLHTEACNLLPEVFVNLGVR